MNDWIELEAVPFVSNWRGNPMRFSNATKINKENFIMNPIIFTKFKDAKNEKASDIIQWINDNLAV